MSNSINEKICIITGANSGIGKATALGLAKLGAKVVMLCRNKTRGEEAQNEIITKSGNKSIDLLLADLSSQSSIRQFVSEFEKKYDKLDVLINNAGVNPSKRYETIDGIEKAFAINTLAPFLLTNLLLPILKNSVPARIINVASAVQSKSINFENLQFKKHFRSWKAYSQSKTALIVNTYEFARRLNGTGVTSNCLHPGAVKSNITRDYKGIIKFFIKLIFCFAKSPKKVAETSVYLASSQDVEKISGKFFIDKKEEKSKDITYNTDIAKRLWDVCADLTNISV
ncbi:MAG: short-chain dehydrogenase [Promethearchaeota archaeon Loki_b32]|nr:MAG: short-chain dehydrogenase [Candidatus Lokiarchaeota archaeon Loki_b32]